MDHPISSSPDSSLQLPLPPLQEFALELSDLDDEVRTLITEAHQNPSIELSTKARASTFPYITGDEDSPLYNDAYAASSLILARQLTLDGKFVEALRALDLGMLRGGVEKWAAVYREVALAAQNGICRPVIGDVDQDAPKSKKARSSPPLHFGSGEPILRVPQSSLSASKFSSDFLNVSKPCIIKLTSKPCPTWTFGGLKNRYGNRLVPIEVYDEKDKTKSYLGKSWDKEIMSFSDYIDSHVKGAVPGGDESKRLGYLAQHPLLSQIPNLLSDLPSLPYTSSHDSLDSSAPPSCEFQNCPILSAWIGPSGTVSPLHNDPYHNLYLQVKGRKYVRIYPISSTSSLYPMSGPRCNTSNVDVDDPDCLSYPDFAGAPYQECVLEEGEALYIPRLSWHYVRGVEPSVNVSMWWGARMGLGEVKGVWTPIY